MRFERDTARRHLTEISERLQSQARLVTEYQEQCGVLQLQLQDRDAEAVSMLSAWSCYREMHRVSPAGCAESRVSETATNTSLLHTSLLRPSILCPHCNLS